MKTLRTGDSNIDAVGRTADVSEKPCFQKEIYFGDNMYSTFQKSNKIVLTTNMNTYTLTKVK